MGIHKLKLSIKALLKAMPCGKQAYQH